MRKIASLLLVPAFMITSASAFALTGQVHNSLQNRNQEAPAVNPGVSNADSDTYYERGVPIRPRAIASCSSMGYDECLASQTCFTHVIEGTGDFYCTDQFAA